MTDTTIEVDCAVREASRHLHFALDHFCEVNILAAYPQAESIELRIQAALNELQNLATTTNPQANPPAAETLRSNTMNTQYTMQAKSEPTTIAHPLQNGAISVFKVSAGVPLSDAFDQLSMLVSSARDALESETMADERGEPSAYWSAMHNLQLAHSLLRAMHEGYLTQCTVIKGKAWAGIG